MGVRFPSSIANFTALGTIVTTAETIIATTAPISPSVDTGIVIISWYVVVTIGTAGTSLAVRIRRGQLLTSALVNVFAPLTVVAGNTVEASGIYNDAPPGVLASQQYSLTLTVGAATGNSTSLDVALIALAF